MTTASWIDLTNASRNDSVVNIAPMLSSVNWPVVVVNAPIVTTSVGRSRNTPTYRWNGTRAR